MDSGVVAAGEPRSAVRRLEFEEEHNNRIDQPFVCVWSKNSVDMSRKSSSGICNSCLVE